MYLVDSNFFIQAHRAVYPLDVVPSFWLKVKELADKGTIISLDKVKNEIYQNEDELKDWCEQHLPDDFFKDATTVILSYKKVIEWANSKSDHYFRTAIDEFMEADEADAWLVAYCLEHNLTMITHERSSNPPAKRKIKIPDACLPFGVKYINTIRMFRELGEKF